MSSQNGKVASEAAQLRLRGVQGPLGRGPGPGLWRVGPPSSPREVMAVGFANEVGAGGVLLGFRDILLL